MTEANCRRLQFLFSMAALPLRVGLAVAKGGAIVLGTSAILVVRALSTPKD